MDAGDPAGHRQFFTFAAGRPFALDGGGTLSDVTIAYETWGALDDDALATPCWSATRGPATATPPARPAAATRRRAGGTAWSGPGLAIDTDRWFVVCANVLGGCQGSTGPGVAASRSTAGRTGQRFPVVTIRDMVRAQARLADHLGIAALALA